MSPDDVDSVVLKLHDFLVDQLGCDLNDSDDYTALADFMHDALDDFITRDRNYN